jgi:hypothetical protein
MAAPRRASHPAGGGVALLVAYGARKPIQLGDDHDVHAASVDQRQRLMFEKER